VEVTGQRYFDLKSPQMRRALHDIQSDGFIPKPRALNHLDKPRELTPSAGSVAGAKR